MMQCFRPQIIDERVAFTFFVMLGVVGVLLWLRRQKLFFGKQNFMIAVGAMAVWLFGAVMEMANPALECKVFWASASWSMIVLLPTAWSFFLMEYCFPLIAERVRPLERILLVGGPAVALVIAATNPMHHLFYGPGTRLVEDHGLISGKFDHGPLFYLLAAYLYLFLGYAVVQTLIGALRAQRPFRMFFAGLFVITAVPALANMCYILFGFTVFGFDPTPFAFSAVLSMLAWMIVNNRLMDTDAIARDVLFYIVPDPVLVIDPKGNLLTANPGGRRLIGEELPNQGLPAASRDWLGPLVDAVTGGFHDDTRSSLSVRGRDYSVSVAPLTRPLNENTAAVGWVLRLHDVTQRRQLQRALDDERDLQAALTETSLSGLIALDQTGAFVFANAEAESLLGVHVTPGAAIRFNDPEWDIRMPDGSEIEGLDTIMAGILTEGVSLRDQRISALRRSDGERRIVSLNATHLPRGRSSRVRIVLSIADVTEQYLYERRLKDAAHRAEAASRAKSQFLANMSHEIRTPLNGVLGMAEVLSTMVEAADQKAMVATIRDSGELLLALLNDILDMAKIEAGKMVLENTRLDPLDLAEKIDTLFWRQADARGLALAVMVPGGTLAPRTGDPHRLQQILQNLVSNAIKFTPSGEVQVTMADGKDGALEIEVKDTGIGMSADQVARIFDEFEQADGSTTRRFGGSGLGMSIVRHIVGAMGGTIAIDSASGKGTTVRVRLPLPADDAAT
ncbi:histidine kinase N-terminal 7TM domain-containing protein [Gemmobacter sp.]|uniref:sensor histidine kinase n=1 Tax=Gemmobacter sp. TaxID=1898957 RepID=UPI002AFDD637|nr:histidine kinase N-terminal 7TM domain-containing protein [Gemmobacter sp.]